MRLVTSTILLFYFSLAFGDQEKLYGFWEGGDRAARSIYGVIEISPSTISWKSCELTYKIEEEQPGVTFKLGSGEYRTGGIVETYLLRITGGNCAEYTSSFRFTFANLKSDRFIEVNEYSKSGKISGRHSFHKHSDPEAYRMVLESKTRNPSSIPGNTAEDRVRFLNNLPEFTEDDVSLKDEYLLLGIKDKAAKVRRASAYDLRGDEFIPQLIKMLTDDPDRNVRTTAALSLSHFITDNGSPTCGGVDEIEKNLDLLLVALRSQDTSGFIVEILGERYAGEKPLPCCMTEKNKQKVIQALSNINVGIPEDDSGWFLPYPFGALENINHCESDLPFWQTSVADEFRSAMQFMKQGEHEVAFPLLLEAAEAGHPEANHWVATYYYKGLATAQSFAEAAKYFSIAAHKGVEGAMLELSQMYLLGEGVTRDCDQARFWFEKATKGNLPVGWDITENGLRC